MTLDLRQGFVEMSHGSVGRAMAALVEQLFARLLDNVHLSQGDDGAVLPWPPGRLVMSTDSYVVSPLFFAGGDIGSLAVHGTVNDVAMMGARPLYLAASFVLEEGLPLADLQRIVESMARAATQEGVLDTKTKELIALAISVAIRCDGCVAFHAQAAVKQGATREEVMETMGMALYMGAGPSLMYAAQAVEAFDQFSEQAS